MSERLLPCAVLALTVAACAARAGGGPEVRATSLRVDPAWFGEPEIVVLKSQPPQFELVLLREAPTPGHAFDVDSTEIDAAARRIRVRFTEKRPQGIVAQVITPTRLRVALGTLERGAWVLELWLRRDEGYEPVQALVLSAR